MMASVNKTTLVGNVGKDPEIKEMAGGMKVARFSLATSSKSKDKATGEYVQVTEWHRIVCFDKLAGVVEQYVTKGKPVYIEGRIKYGKYTNKDGVEIPTVDIVAHEMQLLGGRSDDATTKPAPAPAVKKSPGASGFDDLDDDVPF